jgi:hypothetical protein
MHLRSALPAGSKQCVVTHSLVNSGRSIGSSTPDGEQTVRRDALSCQRWQKRRSRSATNPYSVIQPLDRKRCGRARRNPGVLIADGSLCCSGCLDTPACHEARMHLRSALPTGSKQCVVTHSLASGGRSIGSSTPSSEHRVRRDALSCQRWQKHRSRSDQVSALFGTPWGDQRVIFLHFSNLDFALSAM